MQFTLFAFLAGLPVGGPLGDTVMEVGFVSGCVGVIGHSFGNTPD